MKVVKPPPIPPFRVHKGTGQRYVNLHGRSLYGTGANGKSTLIHCTTGLLGDYAKTATPRLLIRRGGDTHPTEPADLHGVRSSGLRWPR